MLLANLLLELRELLVDPEGNFDEIVDLLAAHDDFAEYEVARHYASQALEPLIRSRLEDPESWRRRRAIHAVERCFSRAAAAKILRHLAKDASLSVRGAARKAIAHFGFDDVALPNGRYAPHNQRWNRQGWTFGTGGAARAPSGIGARALAPLHRRQRPRHLARL